MGKDTYQLLLEGTFVSGCSANKAKNSLSKIFHIDLAKIDKLFENAPVIIKKNLSNETPSSSTQDEMRNNEIIKNLEKKLEQKRFELEERKRRLSVLEKDLENIEYMENAVPPGPGKVIHRSFSTSMGMKTKEYVIEQIEKVEDYVYALENEIYTLENELWELE